MVPQGRIELPTSALPRMRSTTELLRPPLGKAPYSEGRFPGEAEIWLDRRLVAEDSIAMSEDKPEPSKAKPASDREARLAQALRENLRRRKAHRAAPPKPESGG